MLQHDILEACAPLGLILIPAAVYIIWRLIVGVLDSMGSWMDAAWEDVSDD